jgi:hypothetical protein
MADSGKLAAGVLLLGVAALGGGAFFLLRGSEPTDPAPGPVAEIPSAEAAAEPVAALPAGVPSVPAGADPDSVAGRIADLQARIRDEQAEHIAASTALGERVQALRAEMASLEGQIQALDEGKLARLSGKEGKQDDRCDPAEPESRACKRQAALQGRIGDAQAERAAHEARLAEARAEEERLLAERAEHLRAVDTCAERLRGDPELVELYAKLAAESR